MMMLRLLVAVSIALPFAAGAAKQVDVFVGNSTAPWGTTYFCFRVPTIASLGGGKLIALTESRIGSCDDQAPKDITMRRSVDNGASWEPLELIAGPRAHRPGATASRPDFSARNPYLTVVGAGDLLLSWVNSTDPGACVNYQQRSTDAGLTWSPAQRSDYGRWEGVLLGPGTGIVLQRPGPHRGRVVTCGATGYVGGMKMVMPIYYSDDGGATYVEAGGAAPFDQFQECQVVELDDGSVLVNARTAHLNKSCDCRAQARSRDGGRTWGPAEYVPDLVEPTCSAGLINVRGTLYFSNPNSKTKRVAMTLKKSSDSQGTAWTVVEELWAGTSQYSVLVDLNKPDGGAVRTTIPTNNNDDGDDDDGTTTTTTTTTNTVGVLYERTVGSIIHVTLATVEDVVAQADDVIHKDDVDKKQPPPAMTADPALFGCVAPHDTYPFCNTSLPVEDRVRDLISRIDDKVKPNMLTARGQGGNGQHMQKIPELGVPAYYWGTNCLHSLNQAKCVTNAVTGKQVCPTNFPSGPSFGAMFDRDLVKQMAGVIGTELRALFILNATSISLDCWGPVINLNRDPRWGRNGEGGTEDAYAMGELAAAWTKGFQSPRPALLPGGAGDKAAGSSSSSTSSSSASQRDLLQGIITLKHMAVNSLENTVPFSRHTFDANETYGVDHFVLADYYLQPFKSAIRDGGARGIMVRLPLSLFTVFASQSESVYLSVCLFLSLSALVCSSLLFPLTPCSPPRPCLTLPALSPASRLRLSTRPVLL